jgi:putative endonuclease
MRSAGARFERRARDELERAGLRLLDSNYATRHGELDLVMREGDTVVFVEVRHRRQAGYGDAAASVTAGKQARLVLAAQSWLAAHARFAQSPCRFDVVSYDGPEGEARMAWRKGAFEAY